MVNIASIQCLLHWHRITHTDWVFPHFHVWDWSSQLKSQIVRIPLQSFIPCLFSLLVAIKLKPKIVSQGELIVNLRLNCRLLFTLRQTSKHLILALLNILQYSVRVPCARAVTCNTCYSWWTHEMLWVIKCFVRCYRWINSWPLNLIKALNNNSYWINLGFHMIWS